MASQPDPQLSANLSRLISASERFVEASRGLPPPRALKKEVASWTPKRLDKLVLQRRNFVLLRTARNRFR